MPNATPLPRGGLKPDNSSSAASSRRKPAPPPRPDTVALPYNLVWFDSQSRLASLFVGVSAKVSEKKADGPNEIWTVKELIAPNLRTSYFTFQQGMLIGLEFDYGQDNWDTDKYNEVMGQFRRLLETKCESPGEIISRKTDQVPGSTIKETLMGYQWTRGDTNVQLFYYSAEDTEKALTFRSISVHYHYRDPFAPPPGSEPSPAPATATNNAPQPGAAPSPGGKTASVSVNPNGPEVSTNGNLPLPDGMPAPSPAGSPAASPSAAGSPTPGLSGSPLPSPAASPAAGSPAPAASPGVSPAPESTAPPTTAEGGATPPAPTATPDAGDAAAAMAPAPSASPDASASPSPSATATPTPTPSPTPKKKKKKQS